MSNLLPSNKDNVTKLTPMSMDAAWKEAESLGRVKVEQDYGRTSYKAEIMFERKSGTRIHAQGNNSDALFALCEAINEAREMGA